MPARIHHAVRFIAAWTIGLVLVITTPRCSLPHPATTAPPDPATTRPRASASNVTLYDPDPGHLWNRLHHALFVRQSRGGEVFGIDQPDPLLWPESTHLLVGSSNTTALAALDEFLALDGEKLFVDPIKRAVLQSDLWSAFDWAASARQHSDARHALQVRLAKAMTRLALSPDAIKQLPDNYAAAIASKKFAAQFDPAHPQRPFLPPDLFLADGPWVCLGTAGEAVAPAHTRFVSGRSAFLVFLRLPDGRQATLDYLDKLNRFPKPWINNPRYGFGERTEPTPLLLNPELPQFPEGTQVALARQMILMDNTGQLQPTRLTQTLQFRVYRSIPSETQSSNERNESQRCFEFRLSRGALLSGKAGGLRAVEPEELDFIQFNSHSYDQLEERRERVLQTCVACHRGPGILSVNSFTRNFGPQSIRPVRLTEYDREDVARATLFWKMQAYDWGLLQGLTSKR